VTFGATPMIKQCAIAAILERSDPNFEETLQTS